MKPDLEQLARDMQAQNTKIGAAQMVVCGLQAEYKIITRRYAREIKHISTIMNRVEQQVLKARDIHWLPAVSVADLNSNDRIKKINKGLVSISVWHPSRMSCGDWNTSTKIPFAYFEMTDAEIEAAHTAWITKELDARRDKERQKDRAHKEQEYERLKKELGK